MAPILDVCGAFAQAARGCYASIPMQSPQRPDFAPENRSQNAGKIVAIAVFALLLLGGLATLVVVMTRGSSGITPPPQKIPSSRDVVAPTP